MEKYFKRVIRRLTDCGLSAHLLGTWYLADCCCYAAERVAAGEDYIPQRIASLVAEWKGCTGFAIWARMQYALEKAGQDVGVADFMRTVVREVCKLEN